MAKQPKLKDTSKQGFITLFNRIANHKHRYDLFRDFVIMSAISIHNAFVKSEELELEYLQIAKEYKEADLKGISELLAMLIELLEVEPTDVLGGLYMELELGNERNGQFFTPDCVSLFCAQVTFQGAIDGLDNKQFITLSEPASGAGGMILAFVKTMIEQKHSPHEKLFVQAIDICRLTSLMCYLQLSLWNVPAEVIVGNALSMEIRETYYTPAYYMFGWDMKLRVHSFMQRMRKLESELPTEPAKIENVVEQIALPLGQVDLFGFDMVA
jgi:type I restriction-modification system DNA methylase subunit